MYTIRTMHPYRYGVAFIMALQSLPPLPCLKCEGSLYSSLTHPMRAGPSLSPVSPLIHFSLAPPPVSASATPSICHPVLFFIRHYCLTDTFFGTPRLSCAPSVFLHLWFFFRGPVFISVSFFVFVVSLCSLSFPSTLCVHCPIPPVLAAPVHQRNFMSMSNDEDEARDDEDVWSRCVPPI